MHPDTVYQPAFAEEDNALIPAGAAGEQKYDVDAFKAAAKSGDYLSRLKLMTGAAGKCKDGSFPMNHYALIKDQHFQDLGESVDILVVTWRPKALEIGEAIITVFDTESAEFKRIQAKSTEPDSGCMYGPEYLVWISGVKEWATLFMGSKSSRRESPQLQARLEKAATLTPHKIETPKYTWFSDKVMPCSSPIDMPDMEELKATVEKFNNPPVSEIEKVETTGEERAR